MTNTDRKKRVRHAREMYLAVCNALNEEPRGGYNHMTEQALQADSQNKYMNTRSKRRRRKALMVMGLTRKQARNVVRKG